MLKMSHMYIRSRDFILYTLKLALPIIVIAFHFKFWQRHTYLEDYSTLGCKLLSIRNAYERLNHCEGFYWAKVGRFYIRKNYSWPNKEIHSSRKHLFCYQSKETYEREHPS